MDADAHKVGSACTEMGTHCCHSGGNPPEGRSGCTSYVRTRQYWAHRAPAKAHPESSFRSSRIELPDVCQWHLSEIHAVQPKRWVVDASARTKSRLNELAFGT